MVKRSLQASHQGIQSAKLALIDKFGTQQKLADALSVTRQPVNKFFNRKPVDSSLFVEICKKLGLEWQEIQENPQSQVKQASEQESDIDALVQEIREQVKPSIKEKCGTMRVLDMPQPIELTGEQGIYTNVNILEKITGRRRLDIPELLQNFDPDDFERFSLNRVKEKRVPGIEAVQQHQKLMVLGKPGAGKTTFLKYLAMQCIEGQYLTNQVPLFITLKDFAETPKQPDVLEYIAQQLSICGVQDASLRADQLLRQGRVLLLLDGLDEVREKDTKRVLREIRDISDQFHTNQFVITCRIAAKEYSFERFTEVEVADFDEKQIAIFAENWFRLSDLNEAKRFVYKLEQNKRIQELATSPLLLTLLCLVFAEKKDFPKRRSKLYQEGLRILLKKWDAKIFNERDHVYKNLSVQHKEKLLSQIALTTFEQQNYFFEQETVEVYITEFFSRLYHTDSDPEILLLDSEAVLKSIEAQHGMLVERANRIYSFSHLTFHEYFAAKKIVANSAYECLVQHLTEKSWQEVFLLAVGVMQKADNLVSLMKHKVDMIMALDKNLQDFLEWLSQKSSSFEAPYKPAAIRAFYFQITTNFEQHRLDNALGWDSEDTLEDTSLDWLLNDALTNSLAIADSLADAFCQGLNYIDIHDETIDKSSRKQAFINRDTAWCMIADMDDYLEDAICLAFASQSELSTSLQLLIDKLNDPILEWDTLFAELEGFGEWWRENGEDWSEQLRLLMIEHRNIGHYWCFNNEQEQLLQHYYNANKLLVDCLNSGCHISYEVRQEIEDTLLLPIRALKIN
ncbi:NACHT domain family protein [Tolypothrix tenuis PCC 7101]|uniref:NACHT domain family protein n=1 Tax=Tolypothrix tenuis PCC 7101 TaxID=231146 RepID=A0A1Z4N3D0_9CYAN|nr:NACHT domain-containing NTPase [Aulosira sp. FACHB-113]BAZ00218.1 NACHT domain family protein [Tolypothrix tenuis PCC 7101]BAZ75861.1 NACHT domain family protein [Aulosira laxa NIES-50]